MNSSTSRYRVFDTVKFRNAPLSKCLAFSTLAGSLCSIPFRHYRSAFVISDVKNWTSLGQLLKFSLSRVFVLDFKDIVAGCLSIYFMRHVERRYGTRKYAEFLILTYFTAICFEIIIHGLVNVASSNISTSSTGPVSSLSLPTAIAYGPYALLFGSFMQFYCDVPFVPYAKVFSIPLSVKNLPLLFIVQMLISTKEVLISCLSGVLAGIVYRFNVLNVQNLAILPDKLCQWCSYIFTPLLRFGENDVGRLLPMGATLEAQRQDIYERYEQSLIYQSIQRQHLLDEQSENASLSVAERWFSRRSNANANAALPGGSFRRSGAASAASLGAGGDDNDDVSSSAATNGLIGAAAASASAAAAPQSAAASFRQPQQQQQVRPCEEKIRTLVEMGFADRHRVEQVLRNTNNDLNTAALILLQDASSTVA